MKRALGPAIVICASFGISTALADHWTTQVVDPGARAYVCVSEKFLTTGQPWDSDGSELCPPNGADDVRCEWRTDHTNGNPRHELNGKIAAVLDGSASQRVVFLGDQWTDSVNSGSFWIVNYNVHFLAIDPADIPSLRVTMRFQYAGGTRLTLNLAGPSGTVRVRRLNAPTHFWTDSPETGNQWRIELTLQRTQAGSPAMIWVDSIVVTEGGVTLYDEPFSIDPGDLNCDGTVDALDIEGFILALFDPDEHPRQYPGCDINNGDINADGSIDALDIEGFISLLFP